MAKKLKAGNSSDHLEAEEVTTKKVKGVKAPTTTVLPPPKAGKRVVDEDEDLDDAQRERMQARNAGVGLIHYRVLKALADRKQKTYRQIEEATKSPSVPEGYYKSLTKIMRPGHDKSLCTLGLVEESLVGEKDTLVFQITRDGMDALKKAGK